MAACWSCNSAIADGVRWCPVCQASQTDPTVGRLSSPAKRLGAFALDALIFGAFAAVIIVAAIAGFAASGGSEGAQAIINAASDPSATAPPTLPPDTAQAFGVGLIIAALGAIAYLALHLFFYAKGTTPGKRMLGMRVIRENGTTAGIGTMLLREWIGKFVSNLVMSLGFIWILIDANRQGWHDKIASTYVVE